MSRLKGLRPIILKDTIEFVSALMYAPFLLLFRRRPCRIVIYYHAVRAEDVTGFNKQMSYLAKNCRVVKCSEVTRIIPEGTKPVVAVIFDDAFLSLRQNALPILKKYELPAAVAVPTGNMGELPRWSMDRDCYDRNEVVMDAEAVKELDRLGYEILSHTISHCNLTELDDVELNSELCESKQTLEEILGHSVDGISYPFGAHNARVCDAASRAGYEAGFTVEPRTFENSPANLRIGRFSVLPSDGLLKFKLKVRGAYEVVRYLRGLKRGFGPTKQRI